MSFASQSFGFGERSDSRVRAISPAMDRYEALVEVAHSIASHPDLEGLFHDLLQRFGKWCASIS